MNFQTDMGIGEIVLINGDRNGSRREKLPKILGKVIKISFSQFSVAEYLVEITSKEGTQRIWYPESSLTGDPEFDQDNGYSNN
jgi:hypothetical protein